LPRPKRSTAPRRAALPAGQMGSSSDSDSDSDSSACLVYKKTRQVKWSDDEASDDGAPEPIALLDREDSPAGISPGGRSAKRRRTSGEGAVSGSTAGGASCEKKEIDINEILGLSNPVGGASAASRQVNSEASEAIRRNREQMAAMRRAATEKTVEISDDEEDAGPAPVDDAPGGGNPITLKFKLSNGRSHEFQCKDGERFSKILADFLESDAGRPLKGTVQGRMVFDGDIIDMNNQTPKILDMEDEDMVDLN